MRFNSIVMIVATVILILTLTMIGVALKNQKNLMSFPPIISECPDYYEIGVIGQDTICNKKSGLDISKDIETCNKLKISNASYQGTGGLCEKRKWAENCGVTWDGVTNNPDSKNCN
tara:strand:+ start:8611 stop:8958 length:348 start_codon:yes stop_codon:yes gene_type:complete